MDSSTGQSQPSAAPNSGPRQREMMFCHECHDEWYRDERGIICPECGSEFTEIIEDDNDPRDNAFGHNHDDDDDSIPSLEEAPPNIPAHPLADHNPWRDDDPEDSDISSMRFQPIGPGRFHVSATIHRTISPTQLGPGGGNGPNTLGAFTSFLSNMLAGAGTGTGGGARPPGQQQNHTGDGQGNPQSRSGADGQPHVHRFTYTGGARLHPRDANNPGPRLEPVDNLNDVIAGLFAALGEPPGGHSGGHTHGPEDMPMNPLMGLFAAMSGGQHGDAVYSQEALDRIISQLMEQTASSNAPGPATQNDINSLPRRKVTEEMLGAEHRAECSICMDEVNIGEEVTELPCKHWFHHQCVAAWLSEHDTCPHCRKGISKASEGSSNNPAAGSASPSGADPTASMPGAFGVSGAGTFNNPFIVPGATPPSQNRGPGQGGVPNSPNSGNGGGLGERLRRGLFGPHRN